MRMALALTVLPLAATAAEPPAGSWPQFLGPNRNGVSAETGLNLDWRKTPPRVVWKVVVGGGYSSVIAAEGRLYTMVNRGARDLVVALDPKTGRDVWKFDAAPRFLDKQRQGPGPRATPTYHDGKLYCQFPAGLLVCLNAADGKLVWKADALADTKAGDHSGEEFYWGLSASPLVEGDAVIVLPGGGRDNAVAAFDRATGKLLWTVGSDHPGYGSPIAVDAAGKRQILCPTGRALMSVDPAGKLLWDYDFGDKYNCHCATPLFVDGKVFVSQAYGVGSALLEVGPAGARPVWRNKNLQNQFSTSTVVDGHVYGCHGDLGATMLRCVDLATGAVKWTEREPGKCSLLAAQGHLFVLSERGTLRLLEATPRGYVKKGELPNLLRYKVWAAPALIDKRLYVRDETNLICLDVAAR
jgi:outer membrane protein assembly factor BamB